MRSTRRSFVPVTEWTDKRQVLGLEGERVAIGYLTSCGWSIEAHRFKVGRHEIDLITRKGHLVAFVEVKTRCSLVFGSGLQAVNRRKQRDIIRVAGLWVDRFGRTDDHYRFDLIAVQGIAGGTPAIEHVPDAWRAVERWA